MLGSYDICHNKAAGLLEDTYATGIPTTLSTVYLLSDVLTLAIFLLTVGWLFMLTSMMVKFEGSDLIRRHDLVVCNRHNEPVFTYATVVHLMV